MSYFPQNFPGFPIPGKISRFPEYICFSPETALVRAVTPVLCRALNGGAILLVHRFGTGNQQKHLEFNFSLKALFFHSRTSIRAHGNILLKIKRRDFFKQDSIPILVSRTVKTENSEVQVAVFSK